MMPGRMLHRMARFLLPRHACEHIVDAQLADFQHEWTLASGAAGSALVVVRGYAAFIVVFASCAVGMRALGAEERLELRHVFAIAAVGTGLAMVGLAILFNVSIPMPAHADPSRLAELRRFRWVMFINIGSQLVPLAASVGLVCGIATGLKRHASRALRRVVLIGVAASCIAMFVLSSWILPLGFRAVSLAIRGQASLGQPAAATLGDDQLRMMTAEQTPTAGPGTIRGTAVAYYLRYAWPCATFALGIFALSLIHRGKTARMLLGVAACGIYFYLVRRIFSDLIWTTHLWPIVLAWLPNLVFIALAMVIMSFHHSGLRGRTEEVF